jgi:tetratricopeptide (TPR) repeat protein
MNQGNSSTSLLAILGALFGIPAFIWNIIRLFSERRKLSVYATIGLSPANKPTLIFNITNFGRRPIILVQVGIAKKKKKKLDQSDVIWIFPRPWPKTLQEASYEIVPMDRDDNVLAFQSSTQLPAGISWLGLLSNICSEKYRYFFVADTLDKRWRVKDKHIKKVIAREIDIYLAFHWELALKQIESANAELAEKELSLITQKNPSDGKAWYKKGIQLYYLDRYAEAARSFEEAIKYEFQKELAYLNKAISLAHARNTDDAILALEEARKINTKSHTFKSKDEAVGFLLNNFVIDYE